METRDMPCEISLREVLVVSFGYFAMLFIGNRLSEVIGIERIATVPAYVVYGIILFLYFRRRKQFADLGLAGIIHLPHKALLYYLPFIFITLMGMISGFESHFTLEMGVCLIAMIFTGIYEELLCRSLLINWLTNKIGKRKETMAVLISSGAFGCIHFANLLSGCVFFRVIIQVFYAFAVGFMFGMFFVKTHNVIPCMICHSAFDVMTVLCRNQTETQYFAYSILVSVIALFYGGYLLHIKEKA